MLKTPADRRALRKILRARPFAASIKKKGLPPCGGTRSFWTYLDGQDNVILTGPIVWDIPSSCQGVVLGRKSAVQVAAYIVRNRVLPLDIKGVVRSCGSSSHPYSNEGCDMSNECNG